MLETTVEGSGTKLLSKAIFGASGSANAVGRKLTNRCLKVGFDAKPA
jgi:hypothetical protein